jgi:hypothetical protein
MLSGVTERVHRVSRGWTTGARQQPEHTVNKPLVIGQKISFFSKTLSGALASVAIYSTVDIATESAEPPPNYLRHMSEVPSDTGISGPAESNRLPSRPA